MLDDKSASLDAREQRSDDPDRLLTFSDDVFATMITNLVLEFQVPDLG